MAWDHVGRWKDSILPEGQLKFIYQRDTDGEENEIAAVVSVSGSIKSWRWLLRVLQNVACHENVQTVWKIWAFADS